MSFHRSLCSRFTTLLQAAPVLATIVFFGCTPSSEPPPAATAEIRGAPINPPPVATTGATPDPAPPVVSVGAPENLSSPSPVAESPVAQPPIPVAGIAEPEFLPVSFEKLASFEFKMPDELVSTNAATLTQSGDQIPEGIKKLNNQRIALKGFMLPLKVEGGLVTEMLIMRDQSMCCYGTVPKINEWVSAKMSGGGVKAVMDQPVTLYGKLHVGEMRENGYLVGIYSLDGERMADPLDH